MIHTVQFLLVADAFVLLATYFGIDRCGPARDGPINWIALPLVALHILALLFAPVLILKLLMD